MPQGATYNCVGAAAAGGAAATEAGMAAITNPTATAACAVTPVPVRVRKIATLPPRRTKLHPQPVRENAQSS
ncbi:hypothetical protein [Streptomyces sp. SAI-041]|uniref:hypothetical protein n=1 Tax=Streptomyces sp. SAI-041 TaxID=2940548 RepID=UPI002474186E|nr:hypothetical protein [Streptomyces sp. SAI-041]MDH6546416.1 hypothetical protein [Streptomyces sp. SAI-041]